MNTWSGASFWCWASSRWLLPIGCSRRLTESRGPVKHRQTLAPLALFCQRRSSAQEAQATMLGIGVYIILHLERLRSSEHEVAARLRLRRGASSSCDWDCCLIGTWNCSHYRADKRYIDTVHSYSALQGSPSNQDWNLTTPFLRALQKVPDLPH